MKKSLFFIMCFIFGINLVDAKVYEVVTCGEYEFPLIVAQITSIFIFLLQVIAPIIIIIMGSIDFAKAVIANKEDDTKKAIPAFIKRLILGALIFVLIAVVKLVISIATTDAEATDISNCIDCFISGDCNTTEVEED